MRIAILIRVRLGHTDRLKLQTGDIAAELEFEQRPTSLDFLAKVEAVTS